MKKRNRRILLWIVTAVVGLGAVFFHTVAQKVTEDLYNSLRPSKSKHAVELEDSLKNRHFDSVVHHQAGLQAVQAALHDPKLAVSEVVWIDLAHDGKKSEFYTIVTDTVRKSASLGLFSIRQGVAEALLSFPIPTMPEMIEHVMANFKANNQTFLVVQTTQGSGKFSTIRFYDLGKGGDLELLAETPQLSNGRILAADSGLLIKGGGKTFRVDYGGKPGSFVITRILTPLLHVEGSLTDVLSFQQRSDGRFAVFLNDKEIELKQEDSGLCSRKDFIELDPTHVIAIDDNIRGADDVQMKFGDLSQMYFDWSEGTHFVLSPRFDSTYFDVSFDYGNTVYLIPILFAGHSRDSLNPPGYHAPLGVW